MCGISGVFSQINNLGFDSSDLIKKIAFRGPDNLQNWYSKNSNVSFSHSRLSIQDLSKKANQPMHSSSERYVITFNGEIYNHFEIRERITNKKPNFQFKTLSDTETILESVEAFGLKITLNYLIGMFAFAIYDKKNKNLFLVRDRIGEKPLYYMNENKTILFGSEIKCFQKLDSIKLKFDQDAINEFICYGFINKKQSIYKNIYRIEPGTYLTFSLNKLECKKTKYWNAIENVNNNNNNNNIKNIESLFNSVIRQHLISDVPIGTFLSSGIDSSLITSLVAKNYKKKLETFTISFDDKNLNESLEAKKIANHLKTNHNEINFNSYAIKDEIPNMHNFTDQPFADVSLIPTYLLSKNAKKIVKVVLTGDGGDEVFCGYKRHRYVHDIWKIQKNFPIIFNLLHKSLNLKKNKSYNNLKLSFLFKAKNIFDLYNRFLNDKKFNNTDNEVYIDKRLISILSKENLSDFEKFILLDLLNYLPNNILVKSDRASMINSLEIRSPFLDKRIIEYALNMKIEKNINLFNQKILIKKLLNKYVPINIISYKKKGFTPPISKWMKKELKEWGQELINDTKGNPYLDNSWINENWNDYLNNKNNNYKLFWNIIILQNWINFQK